MIGVEISDAYLAPLVGASFVASLGLIAWIVKLLFKITNTLANQGARLESLEREREDRARDERERARWHP